MPKLFGRIFKVTVFRPDGQPIDKPIGFTDKDPGFQERYAYGVEIVHNRVTFSITKSLTSDPNTCEISIFNLNENDRALLTKQRPLTVRLEAGHDGVARHLFLGTVKFGDSYHKGTEWETKLTLSDGGRAFANARIAKSYGAGTPVRTILKDAVASMGMVLPPNLEKDTRLDARIPKGDQLDGLSRDELTRYLAPYGYSFSIQNQQMQILSDADTREDVVRVINKKSGLIGTPEYGPPDKKNGQRKLKFTCIVFPELTPGGKVEMDSTSVKGLHKLLKVTHAGDTRGNQWETTCEARVL